MYATLPKPGVPAGDADAGVSFGAPRVVGARGDLSAWVAIVDHPQQWPVGGGPQGPLPVVGGLVGAALLRRQPRSRLVQRTHGEVDDGLRAGLKAHILARCRQEK